MTKKIGIVGGGPSQSYAPIDGSQDLWVVGIAAPNYHEHAKCIFEIHHDILSDKHWRWEDIKAKSGTKIAKEKKNSYIADLQAAKCPVIMSQKFDEIPMSEPLPIQKLVDQFGYYFSSTVSYMIALALFEDYDEYYFYGIDMDQEEYEGQRPACEYYIGVLRGMGKSIFIPEISTLLKYKNLYGLE